MNLGSIPDFFLIGAAKSGTTAFFDLLTRQPKIFVPSIKEPNYFALGGERAAFTGPGDDEGINRRSVWRSTDYQRLFSDVAPDQISGESSVIYLPSPIAPQTLSAAKPDARILVILRDPVDRAFSAFRHLRRDGREPCSDFARALDAEPQRIRAGWEPLWYYEHLGRYADQLQTWWQCFPRSQFLILRYEQFQNDPHATLVAACEFLDVPMEDTSQLGKRHNVSGIPRSAHLQSWLVGNSPVKKLARQLLPRKARHQLWSTLMRANTRSTSASVPSDVMEKLRQGFLPQINRLEQLLGWDLSAWKPWS